MSDKKISKAEKVKDFKRISSILFNSILSYFKQFKALIKKSRQISKVFNRKIV